MPFDTSKRLWRCPECGAKLVTKNMSHSCGRYTLKDLFGKSDPSTYKIFRRVRQMVRACGPCIMIPQKTRVVFMVRVRFIGVYPRKHHLLCSIALPRRSPSARFVQIEEYAPHFMGHFLRINSEDQLDGQVQAWFRESYTVGTQEALRKRYGGQLRRSRRRIPSIKKVQMQNAAGSERASRSKSR